MVLDSKDGGPALRGQDLRQLRGQGVPNFEDRVPNLEDTVSNLEDRVLNFKDRVLNLEDRVVNKRGRARAGCPSPATGPADDVDLAAKKRRPVI
jgi:hypothetical protein